jgi:hypothetical protein
MNRTVRLAMMGVMLVGLPWILAADDVQIRNEVPLSFGNLVSGPTEGTVTISSSGGTTTTGGVVAFGGGSAPASFSISIARENPNYTIILPRSASLSGTGGSMVLDSFESTPKSGSNIRPPAGFETMTVGATLHVAANQPAGSYSGSFNIIVSSQ